MKKEVIGDCTLYLGDCLELVQDWPSDASVVSDPPYGISYKSPSGKGKTLRGDYDVIVGDDKEFDPMPFMRFQDVILFGGNHFANKLPNSAKWLVWDKRDGMTPNNNSDCEMAWCKNGGSARLIRHLWNGMLKASEKEARRTHPTQKPIEVMKWAITHCEKKPSLIIDPFCGSGSTLVAATQMRISSIGVEIDEKYFETACKRIEQASKQTDLFYD